MMSDTSDPHDAPPNGMTEKQLATLAQIVVAARRDVARRTGCSTWDFPGVKHWIREAEKTWPSWPEVWAAAIAVATKPEIDTPKPIADWRTFGPDADAVEAAKSRTPPRDPPCPDHPGESAVTCQACRAAAKAAPPDFRSRFRAAIERNRERPTGHTAATETA